MNLARNPLSVRRNLKATNVAVLACVLSACGPGSSSTTPRPGETVNAPGPGASQYNTESSATTPSADPMNGAVTGGVQDAAIESGQELEADARLNTLASWLLTRTDPEDGLPPTEIADFFAHHLGLVEPPSHLVLLARPAEGLREAVGDSVSQFMRTQTYTHFGIAVEEREGAQVVLVALTWRNLTMEPIARRVSSTESLVVRGSLAEGFENPRLVIQRPDGSLDRLPAGSGNTFDLRVALHGPGLHRIEMLGRSSQGDRVIANFPIYVDEEPPTSLQLQRAPGVADGVEAVEGRLVELVNESRAQAGLDPLVSHTEVRAVALAHSQDMAAHDFVGHRSPTSGDPDARVNAAGIHTGLVLENIGRGYSAEQIHDGLMASPGHRANILNSDVTHLGVGVVAVSEGDRSAYIATELFIRQASTIATEGLPQELVASINQARQARNADELTLDEQLSAAAQSAAEDYFADPELTREDVIDDAGASLRHLGIVYSRIGAVMAVVSSPSEATRLEPTLERGIGFIGVGVAQGTRPDTGPNAIAIVYVLAWPR